MLLTFQLLAIIGVDVVLPFYHGRWWRQRQRLDVVGANLTIIDILCARFMLIQRWCKTYRCYSNCISISVHGIQSTFIRVCRLNKVISHLMCWEESIISWKNHDKKMAPWWNKIKARLAHKNRFWSKTGSGNKTARFISNSDMKEPSKEATLFNKKSKISYEFTWKDV